MKVLSRAFITLGAVAVATAGWALFDPYGRTRAEGTSGTILWNSQIDQGTLELMRRACRNCHSQQTEWPWYSRIAPMSWAIARDVQQARGHMNLSRWQDYSADDRNRLLSEIGSSVRTGEMPVRRYLWLHPEARLTDSERQQIYQWTRAERARLVRKDDP